MESDLKTMNKRTTMSRFFLSVTLLLSALAASARASPQEPQPDPRAEQIRMLEERIALLEQTVQTLLDAERTRAATVTAAPIIASPPAPPPPVEQFAHIQFGSSNPTSPELLPEIGKVGAEVGMLFSGSLNPYHLGTGESAGGFIDLPLFDRPAWLHGKVSYEISIGLSRVKQTFTTTSNVAQVANLTVLNAVNPAGGLQNVLDSVSGTGAAPFPVTAPTTTTMKLLQVVPFSFKYTTTVLDRFRLRPYALLGFGAYVTIHEQSPTNIGVRTNANLPPAVLFLVESVYGGTSPFGAPLVAGQIGQSPELEARGLPSGHGNLDLGYLAGGGIEYRVTHNLSLGLDGRWNRIADAPGSLFIFGARFGMHF
jgi:opacity protein-like surface antigen